MKYKILIFLSKIIPSIIAKVLEGEIYLIDYAKTNNKTFRDIIENKEDKGFEKSLLKNTDFKSRIITKRVLRRISSYVLKNKIYYIRTICESLTLYLANLHKNKVLKEKDGVWYYENFALPRNHFNNQIFWDKYFITELKTLDKVKNGDIVDVGAFIGDSAILFEKYTNKNVLAFEPVTSSYDDLLKTIKINNSDKIIPYKFGLGSHKQELLISIFDSSGVGATLRQDRKEHKINKQETIKIDKLDDIVKNENLKIGLIKVDVEGAEQDFLEGALDTIKSQKPALIIAIYHTGEDFFEIKTKIENLNLGYKFKIRKATKNGILDDTVLIAEVV